jgi:type II secretory pathway pseudopilin PulG
MPLRRTSASSRGISLIETLIAITVMTVGVGALSQLFVVATRANHRAALITGASVVAQQKLEELRGSAFTASVPSPADSLTRDISGYCDRVDASGRVLAPDSISGRAGFIRRWSLRPWPADPADTIVVQVAVRAADEERAGELAHVVDVRTRRSW